MLPPIRLPHRERKLCILLGIVLGSLLSLTLGLTNVEAAFAQNTQTAAGDSNGTTSGGAPLTLNVQRGNPLQGLFTPQPQYITPQTIMNPEATAPAAGELNPLKGLFTPQPQFVTPQTLPNQDGRPPEGEVNHLKGVFTPQPQFVTPQTLNNPQALPKSIVPERALLWGSDEQRRSLVKEHLLNTFPELSAPPPITSSGASKEMGTAARTKPSLPTKTVPRPRTKVAAPAPGGAPPATAPPSGQLSNAGTGPPHPADSPIRKALAQIRTGHNDAALELLNDVISNQPSDAQPHYLKAIALVNMRKYNNAADEYNRVLQLAAPSDKITDLAREGLRKIGAQ